MKLNRFHELLCNILQKSIKTFVLNTVKWLHEGNSNWNFFLNYHSYIIDWVNKMKIYFHLKNISRTGFNSRLVDFTKIHISKRFLESTLWFCCKNFRQMNLFQSKNFTSNWFNEKKEITWHWAACFCWLRRVKFRNFYTVPLFTMQDCKFTLLHK